MNRRHEGLDLVGTCPKDFFREWIEEGDAAGEPASGRLYGWFTRHPLIAKIRPGNRFYVVAHGRLRGFAPVVRVERGAIVRRGGAVAVTIAAHIPGFRGLRARWWRRDEEFPFPAWREISPAPASGLVELPLFRAAAPEIVLDSAATSRTIPKAPPADPIKPLK